MAELSLQHVDKIYDNNVQAVFDFNLDVKDKEFIVFVGPSGCGKSTVLRMIAGLEEITSGELWMDGKLMNYESPGARNVSMVFQNYALYPHMSIYDNLAFSLVIRKIPKKEIKNAVMETAKMLGIDNLLDRKPAQLSGGQRQRVAIGSAILRKPNAFLMDEPLSNLDAKMRTQMRSEIASLYNRFDTTFIYVTHDQTEAMTLGTRIVVLKDGVIMQVDSPQKLYNEPNNLFVAGFIGSPQMNFIDTKCKVEGDKVSLTFDNTTIVLPPAKAKKLADAGCNAKTVVMGIRPEDIGDSEIEIEAHQDCAFEADVTGYELLGSEVLLYFKVAGTSMTAKVDSRTTARMGDHIKLAIDPEKIHVFDKETELTITN